MTKKDNKQEPDVIITVDENNNATMQLNLKNSGSFVSNKHKKAIQEAAKRFSEKIKMPQNEEIQVFHFNQGKNIISKPNQAKGGTNMAEALAKVREVLKDSRTETHVEDTNKKKPK